MFEGGNGRRIFNVYDHHIPIEMGDLHGNVVIEPLNWIIIRYYGGLMKESLLRMCKLR